MLVFDFFSGTGSSTQAFRDAGHTVITFELDPEFLATENIDVFLLNAKDLISKYGQPDFVWASPPCTAFSVASIGHHWLQGGENPIPKTEAARVSQDLVQHTISLIEQLEPKYGYLIENPRGMLRKLPVVKNLNRYTITYCQYGDSRMKPTDLWGLVPGWTPRTACKNGMTCHVAAPRGAKTGTQGIKGAKNRSQVPYELGEELLDVLSTTLIEAGGTKK
jgi:hypothetical protein